MSEQHPSDFRGRTVIVTGGARGLGRAISEALAREGANLVVNYNRSADAARALADELRGGGTQVEIVQADVADPEAPERIAATASERFGRIDGLVNNSGITRDAQLLNLDRPRYLEVIDVNLVGAAMLATAVIPHMLEAGYGRIVNISSFVGQKGNFGQANYAAAKGGLISWTKTAAFELARKGITVNAVCPGFVETDMLAGVREDVREKIMQRIPMRRFAAPAEIADAVVFALKSSYMTGAQLDVNGGIAM